MSTQTIPTAMPGGIPSRVTSTPGQVRNGGVVRASTWSALERGCQYLIGCEQPLAPACMGYVLRCETGGPTVSYDFPIGLGVGQLLVRLIIYGTYSGVASPVTLTVNVTSTSDATGTSATVELQGGEVVPLDFLLDVASDAQTAPTYETITIEGTTSGESAAIIACTTVQLPLAAPWGSGSITL